ncbi:GMC oxidoreductase [Cerasicoccus frondis]|uniref:GMC oxidoreductase n=1 Tax=Cerasicoccus frondis TaxID=490090 RepID=UPI0028527574|nr:GMC oxidoreductase [Cerasicoccus frondis]
MLADELADHYGNSKRILVIEAGSYLLPTHSYNVGRFSNADVAKRFGSRTFWQFGSGDPHGRENYIHEELQLNLGGRSIFWSGLIPTIQPWELAFFPQAVRNDLTSTYLKQAGSKLNQSVSMGKTAQAIVNKLRSTNLVNDFIIEQTPRALHQPYLNPTGVAVEETYIEPTGVFNTAELLINQLGLPGNRDQNQGGLFLLLNHYVEDIIPNHNGDYRLVVKDVINDHYKDLYGRKVILAAGSIGSPKLLARSTVGQGLPQDSKNLIGRGLTDHPTTDWVETEVTHINNLKIPRNTHAKIVLYSKGLRDAQGQIKYPFNVEININHEYWHLRENDPTSPQTPISMSGPSRMDFKFSFANCLDNGNEIKQPPSFGYIPEIYFRNLHWTSHLTQSRFPALAKWQKSDHEVFAILNEVSNRILSQFNKNGQPVTRLPGFPFGKDNKDFGFGTVHHAVGTLRMPAVLSLGGTIQTSSVVDENLKLKGVDNIYVSDMSVMPFSSAANPVKTLSALVLRLSDHIR